MKIKALSRPTSSQQTPGAEQRQPRNLDPALHPFAKAREYTRALNATKLDRMFAAPFLGDLHPGHIDGVYSFAKDPNSLQHFASGSGDGVVKVWDLPSQEEKWQAQAHDNIVKGMCWTRDKKLLSCGADRKVQLFDPYNTPRESPPVATYLSNVGFTGISHHRHQPAFAVSGGSSIYVYDETRPGARPTDTMSWPTTVDTINDVAFNQTETSIVASAASDRGIVMYDLRTSSPIHRTVLTMASNKIAWNPMEAFNFACANEDHNIYLFDMRNMKRALNVLRDHVAAVMDVEFSPTGEELVSASYDRTIRLFDRTRGHSRDIYHTKRMQRVFCSTWTPDNNYILSGSDDGNIRLWRARASSRQGIKSFRELQALQYGDKLKKDYAHMPEIRRIQRHRHVPKPVKKAGEIKRIEVDSIKRKEENERRHSKKKEQRRKPDREKMIMADEA